MRVCDINSMIKTQDGYNAFAELIMAGEGEPRKVMVKAYIGKEDYAVLRQQDANALLSQIAQMAVDGQLEQVLSMRFIDGSKYYMAVAKQQAVMVQERG